MSRYLVLIPADEAAWEARPQEDKQRVYDAHGDFAKLLADRGHTFVSGAELAPSSEATVVSGPPRPDRPGPRIIRPARRIAETGPRVPG